MRHPAFVVFLCVVVHVLVGASYSFHTPLWESYDENGHYSYARYLATQRALPPVGQKIVPSFDESHQPPLYYVLMATVIGTVDTSDDAQPRFAPGPRWGVAPDRELDQFPYQGTALAMRLARLMTLLMSCLGVVFTYLAARFALPRRTGVALLATAIYALWPMWLFLSGVISNDSAISVFGSLTLAIVAYLWFSPTPARLRAYLALSLCLAGAALTKDSAIALFLFAGIGVGLRHWSDARRGQSDWRLPVLGFVLPLVALCVLAIFVSDGRVLRQFNTALDFTRDTLSTIAPEQTPAATSTSANLIVSFFEALPSVIPFVLQSTFGAFGWGTVSMPPEWYVVTLGLTIVAVAGLVIAATRPMARKPVGLLMAFVGCVLLAPLTRAFLSRDYNLLLGRFLMPALSGVAVLIALGLLSLPKVVSRFVSLVSLGWIAWVGLVAPWLVLMPAYRPPALLASDRLPDGIQVPQEILFGDSVTLLGHSLPRLDTRVDEFVPITLYWRSTRPLADDYVLRLAAYDIDGRSLQVHRDFTPGAGTFPTSFWKPGDTFAETYGVRLSAGADVPTLIDYRLAWYKPGTRLSLQPVCPGQPVCDQRIGNIPVRMGRAAAQRWQNMPAQYRLGDIADILEFDAPDSARPGDTITLTLTWRARSDVTASYTAFVHVISADANLVAQLDSVPRGGRFPTQYWFAGDIVPDQFALPVHADAPPGAYKIKIGLYETQSRDRLPVFSAAGEALPDGLVPLLDVRITR